MQSPPLPYVPISPHDAAYVDGVIMGMEITVVLLALGWLGFKLPGWIVSAVQSYRQHKEVK